MASIESILQLIVDRPGLTAAELGDELEIASNDAQSRLVKYIENGHVRRDTKKVGGRDVYTYFPAQSLVNEADGVKRVVTAAAKRPPGGASSTADGDFTFGFFSNGGLSIAKGAKEIKLGRDEATRLIAFLDAINIDQISASA